MLAGTSYKAARSHSSRELLLRDCNFLRMVLPSGLVTRRKSDVGEKLETGLQQINPSFDTFMLPLFRP
jgi:hypothetical protein